MLVDIEMRYYIYYYIEICRVRLHGAPTSNKANVDICIDNLKSPLLYLDVLRC